MKERISLTIEKELLREIDRITKSIYRSRSDAFESIVRSYLRGQRHAVILAGGEAKNLYIRELRTYRPLVSIGDRLLIEDSIAKCRLAGFVNISIIGSPLLLAKLYEVLGDGEQLGVTLNYIQEKKLQGSAKTLALARSVITSDFLFLPCDFYFDLDLASLYAFHRQQNTIATIGVFAGTTHSWRRGIVTLDGPLIMNYEERPKVPQTTLIGLFLGFMKPDIFTQIPPGTLNWSLQDDVFPRLAHKKQLAGCSVSGSWVNVHTKADVEAVKRLTNTAHQH
ncbi:MAG: hypothetical protein KKA90_04860 [Nanoarchaeota archaeon]|nr:hypothetical protein [Nanoarchaeota archaeon]